MIRIVLFVILALTTPVLADMSCASIVDDGWAHLPPGLADYIRDMPNASKLGFQSDCNLENLVFSQCWVNRKLSVREAVKILVWKIEHGKRLPSGPPCGA